MTEIQTLKSVYREDGRYYYAHGSSTYTFNPWKELFGHQHLDFFKEVYLTPDWKRAFETLQRNPKRGVEKIRDMYELFVKLPMSLQDEIWNKINTNSCNPGLNDAALLMPFDELSIVYRVKNHTPEEHRENIGRLLELLLHHNICVGKVGIVKTQMDDLLGYDTKRIPTRWERGHLESSVLTETIVRELKRLLQKKKIKTYRR